MAEARGFPITLDVAGLPVVVVGGDAEAERRVALLLGGNAVVQLIAPGVTPGLAAEVAAGRLSHLQRSFAPSDLDRARLVLVTERDPELARTVYRAAQERRVWCWSLDQPAASDFALPAVAHLGPATVTIATSGHSPYLAARLRAALETELGERFGRFVEALGARRRELFESEPDADRRRAALRQLLDEFELSLRVRYPSWF